MLPDPLPLRAHNALCLQGFRGEGYSPEFVDRMQAIYDTVREDPARRVKLLTEPDALCDACPNLESLRGCTLRGPGHEAHMREQDETVLERLGLEAGTTVAWSEVLERIKGSIRGDDLTDVCTICPWLPLGWCAEGIDALRDDPPSERS